jgi:hypothetical protein
VQLAGFENDFATPMKYLDNELWVWTIPGPFQRDGLKSLAEVAVA